MINLLGITDILYAELANVLRLGANDMREGGARGGILREDLSSRIRNLQ
jgi:hypothetical protein